MAKEQANLTPKDQQLLFDLLKKAGQQPTSGGQDQSVQDPNAQIGIGDADYGTIQNLFNQGPQQGPALQADPSQSMGPQQPVAQGGPQQPQPNIQMQPGDQMHPMDAINHIASGGTAGSSPGGASGGHLIIDSSGRLRQTQPGLFGLYTARGKVLEDSTNYLPFYQKEAGSNAPLPDRLMQLPNGQKFLSGEQLKTMMTAKSLMPTSNNPPVDKATFVGMGYGTAKQWKDSGLSDDATMPLTAVRAKVLASNVDAKMQMVTNQRMNALLQYGGPGAAQKATEDAYSRLSNLNRADGIYNVIEQGQDGKADKRQRALYLTEIARVINPSGVITNEALNNLATDTAGQKVNDWKEWFLNEATPTDFKGFLPSLKALADQEKQVNQGLYAAGVGQGLAVMRPINPSGVATAQQAMQNNPIVTPPSKQQPTKKKSLSDIFGK